MFNLVKTCFYGRGGRKLLHLPGGFDSRTMSVRCSNEFNGQNHQPGGVPKTKFENWVVIDFDPSVYLVFRVVFVVLQGQSQFFGEIESQRSSQIVQEPLSSDSTNSRVSENLRVDLIDCFTSCDERNGVVQIIGPRK